MPLIRDELSLSLTEVGMITSAVIVTMTLAHFIIGYLGDRGWRDIFISISVLSASIVMLFASFATSFLFLLGTQIALGLGVSGYHPSSFPAISDRFPKRERAKAVGVNAMGGLVGMAMIPAMGVAFLVLLGGWRESVLALGFLGVLFFIPTFALMRYSGSPRHAMEENTSEVCEGTNEWTRNYYIVILYAMLRGIPFRCTTLLMPIYLVDQYGYEPVWAGSLTAVMLVAGLAAEIISAPISDKSGKRVAFMALSMGLSVPFFLLLNYSLNLPALIAVLIGIGFLYFFGVPPGQAYETEVCPQNAKGLAFGVLFSLGAIPGALSPIVFGYIGDVYGLEVSILFLAVVSLIGTIVTLFLRDIKPQQDEISFYHKEV